MTKKRYHDDAYQTTFSTNVVEQASVDGAPALILEETLFYPTSGGQPHDTGTLNGIPVLDVQETDDHQIVHLVDAPIDQDVVEGRIDWDRRFDYMQQHTGQHLLSQAFMQTCEADTLSFHLGDKSSTIDISTPDMTADHMAETESLANQIVYENRPVLMHLVTQEELRNFRVRKMPKVEQNIRIIEIQDFDFSPCGGTHCAHTGELGLIKIRKWENYKGGTRVHFLCGNRALQDFQQKTELLRQLTDMLTAGETDLPAIISRLQEEAKQLRKELAQNTAQLLEYEARVLLAERITCGAFLVLTKTFQQRSPKDLKLLSL